MVCSGDRSLSATSRRSASMRTSNPRSFGSGLTSRQPGPTPMPCSAPAPPSLDSRRGPSSPSSKARPAETRSASRHPDGRLGKCSRSLWPSSAGVVSSGGVRLNAPLPREVAASCAPFPDRARYRKGRHRGAEISSGQGRRLAGEDSKSDRVRARSWGPSGRTPGEEVASEPGAKGAARMARSEPDRPQIGRVAIRGDGGRTRQSAERAGACAAQQGRRPASTARRSRSATPIRKFTGPRPGPDFSTAPMSRSRCGECRFRRHRAAFACSVRPRCSTTSSNGQWCRCCRERGFAHDCSS